MRTSLNDLRLTEEYLLQQASGSDSVLFQARLILEPGLQDNLYWQQKTYGVVKQYGRRLLQEEIEQIHQTLFTAPQHRHFRQRILRLFKK